MKKEEIRALFPTERCIVCNNPINPDDPTYFINDKPAHEDCYDSELSKEIDEHPIHAPGMHI